MLLNLTIIIIDVVMSKRRILLSLALITIVMILIVLSKFKK